MAIVGAALVVATAVLAASAIVVASTRLDAAADATALSVADTAAGWADGDPCERGAVVAEANGAVVAACNLDGLTATVTLRATAPGGLPLSATARAGPAGE